MKKHNFSAIVLAAGEGKRMKSKKSKVLHEISGQTLIERTLSVVENTKPEQIITVVNKNNISEIKKMLGNKILCVLQSQPRGTGDATAAGLSKVRADVKTVCVMYGDDTAFYQPETIEKVYDHHRKSKATVTFVVVKLKNPTGFGRVIRKNGQVAAIIEEKDTTGAQKKINEINDGVYFFDKDWLLKNINKLKPSEITGEFYITDMISEAIKQRKKVETFTLSDSDQWHSVNTREELQKAQEKHVNNIHIMGILGAGASAVAGIAKGFRFQVNGCDLISDSPYAKNLNVSVKKGHDLAHLKNVGMLVVSPSVLKFDPQNPEIQAAKKRNIPTLTWQEFQGKFLQKGKFVIAVAGAYGKSTTTAMISQILIDQNLDPTCEIGAKVLAWGQNFRVGKSKYYVCEGDEYNDNFLNYSPDIAVILNLGWDHPDYFHNRKAVFESFKKFVANIKKGGMLAIRDDKEFTGFANFARSDIKVVKITDVKNLKLSLIGDFRRENANAALTVAQVLGLDLTKARESIEEFRGLGRRLEYKGQINGVKVYDDYAVQPYTVLATANALAKKYQGKRLALVFEPHTFTRIKFFFDEFVKNLTQVKVDAIFLTDVYAAREKGDKEKLSRDLVAAIGKRATFSGSLAKTAQYLKKHLNEFDVVLSMGAGNVYKFWDFLNST